jgi:hypothetical protein
MGKAFTDGEIESDVNIVQPLVGSLSDVGSLMPTICNRLIKYRERKKSFEVVDLRFQPDADGM